MENFTLEMLFFACRGPRELLFEQIMCGNL
jgi:hypothetical protein